MKIKTTNSAGTFYPADKTELLKIIDDFFSKVANDSGYYSRAIIVPHAGYIFSGALSAHGFKYLNPDSENIFIFAPSHYARLFGCVSCNYDEFETPLGNCDVNTDLVKNFTIDNEAFEKEHSIEVQLPFIKYFFPNAKIIPVLYGCENYKNIAEIIKSYWGDKKTSFVISSDLSHFYPERDANKIDKYTAQMIETGYIKDFDAEQACGAVGICGLVDFAKENKYSLIRIGLTNSAAAAGDSSRVVGYGSWFLYEGDKNNYLKTYYRDMILDICRKSIMSGLQIGNFGEIGYPAVFEETGAVFVTLTIEGELRGCVGSVVPHRTLLKDLQENAHSAAFKDTRFEPLTGKEFPYIDIEVSLLSYPERIIFSTEEELLDKITPSQDGIIIRDGEFQSVYLPDVWEDLPDKREFMKSLKLKAGMEESYFSDTFQAFKFHTVKIL